MEHAWHLLKCLLDSNSPLNLAGKIVLFPIIVLMATVVLLMELMTNFIDGVATVLDFLFKKKTDAI